MVDRALEGVDVCIHLAGTSVERPLPEIIENNLRGLYELYQGARRHKVRRIVFASSNHAFGMYSVNDKLDPDAAYRPDGFYGLSKAWGEAMARMYWDKHGVGGISIRIGSCLPKPTEFRHLSTWLGHEDYFHLIDRCINAPPLGYVDIWGISRNTRRYWNFGEGERRLGYEPKQDAEVYAAEIMKLANPLDATAQKFQGGGFVTQDLFARGLHVLVAQSAITVQVDGPRAQARDALGHDDGQRPRARDLREDVLVAQRLLARIGFVERGHHGLLDLGAGEARRSRRPACRASNLAGILAALAQVDAEDLGARGSASGRSTKKISSRRPLRTSSGGSASMSFEVATMNTRLLRSAIQVSSVPSTRRDSPPSASCRWSPRLSRSRRSTARTAPSRRRP